MGIFPTFFFSHYKPEKYLLRYHKTNEKTPILAIKTRSLKSRKIDIFPKGLTHSFGPKMAILPTLFLGSIGQKNVFYDIVERKNAFLRYKKKKFKNSKN